MNDFVQMLLLPWEAILIGPLVALMVYLIAQFLPLGPPQRAALLALIVCAFAVAGDVIGGLVSLRAESAGRFIGSLAALVEMFAAAYLIADPWRSHRREQMEHWSLARYDFDRVMSLSPTQFEHFVAFLLAAVGWRQTEVIGGRGDRGVDVMAVDPEGHVVAVQCKHYAASNLVGSREVQTALGGMTNRRAHRLLFVTTSGFTRDARALADDCSDIIELWEGDDLVRLMAEVRARNTMAVPTPRSPRPARVLSRYRRAAGWAFDRIAAFR